MIEFLLGLFVSPSLCLLHFGQLLRYADKRIVNIVKVYLERNNMEVGLIWFHKKYQLYSRLLLRSKEFCDRRDVYAWKCLFPCTLFAWKVVTTSACSISANSTLICYSSLRFWRSSSTRVRDWTHRLVYLKKNSTTFWWPFKCYVTLFLQILHPPGPS